MNELTDKYKWRISLLKNVREELNNMIKKNYK
jgi:hypothetical protein